MCILVIIGADKDGNKGLVAVGDGYRKSALSWKDILLDLRRRGWKEGPQLFVADGGLGFWVALDEVFPQSKERSSNVGFTRRPTYLMNSPWVCNRKQKATSATCPVPKANSWL